MPAIPTLETPPSDFLDSFGREILRSSQGPRWVVRPIAPPRPRGYTAISFSEEQGARPCPAKGGGIHMARGTLYLPLMIAAAVLMACAVALSAVSEKAEATFPGKTAGKPMSLT